MHRESTSAVIGAAVVAFILPTLLLAVSSVVLFQVGAALAIAIPWWMRLPVGSMLAMEGTTRVLARSSGTRPRLGSTSVALCATALPIGIGLAMVGTALATYTILVLPLSAEYLALREAQYEPILAYTSTLGGGALVFLTVAVVPGIFEERAFRGALLTHCNGWPTRSRALLSGIVFALVHLDPVSLLALMFVGFTLTVVADRAGGWVVPAVAHAALNAFNTLVWPAWFGTREPSPLQALVLVFVGLSLVGVGLRWVTLLSDARRSASVQSVGLF
jgi:membrane protease YdiL (CAAX protease family)